MRLLNNKPVQALLAVGPLMLLALCFMGYFAFFISVFGSSYEAGHAAPPSTGFLSGFNILLLIAFLLSALLIVSTVYFVLHVVQNPLLENTNMRIVWILVIILLSGIGNFIYWLVEIRNKTPGPVIGDSINHKKRGEWAGGIYMKS